MTQTLKDTWTQLFLNATPKMRKRKRGSAKRGFNKLSMEASPRWYFQYTEVWVTNAVRFITDCQNHYPKKNRHTTFSNNELDANENFICSFKILLIMFARNTKPQSKHSNCRRWISVFCKVSKTPWTEQCFYVIWRWFIHWYLNRHYLRLYLMINFIYCIFEYCNE